MPMTSIVPVKALTAAATRVRSSELKWAFRVDEDPAAYFGAARDARCPIAGTNPAFRPKQVCFPLAGLELLCVGSGSRPCTSTSRRRGLLSGNESAVQLRSVAMKENL